MKCYTVLGEEVRRGLEIIKNAEGKPVLKIGSGSEKSELPVGKGVAEMFEGQEKNIPRFRDALYSFRNGGEVEKRALRSLAVEVSGQDFIDFDFLGFAEDWEALDPDILVLEKADLSTNEPWRIIKERVKTDSALIHFKMESSGQQDLYANICKEVLMEGRHPYVRKDYNSFPPEGVLVEGIGRGSHQEQQGLFLMYPRSSFRVHRDEDPPVLVVAWPGSTLRCFAPANCRSAKKQKGKRSDRVA